MNGLMTHTALHAPGTWYLRCSLDNQYLACVFELSASKANSKFSLAPWHRIRLSKNHIRSRQANSQVKLIRTKCKPMGYQGPSIMI